VEGVEDGADDGEEPGQDGQNLVGPDAEAGVLFATAEGVDSDYVSMSAHRQEL